MRFVSTGHIDTQNGEAALGATLVAANVLTPQTLPLFIASDFARMRTKTTRIRTERWARETRQNSVSSCHEY